MAGLVNDKGGINLTNYHNTGKEDLLHYMKGKIKALEDKNIELQKIVDIAKEFISISKECQTCPCDSEYMMTSCEVCPYNSEVKFDELEQVLAEFEG